MKESVSCFLLGELNHSMSRLGDYSRLDGVLAYWHYWHIEFIVNLFNRQGVVVFYDDVSKSWHIVK